jgi:hypothetical protein
MKVVDRYLYLECTLFVCCLSLTFNNRRCIDVRPSGRYDERMRWTCMVSLLFSHFHAKGSSLR